jgi:uncharacterized protein DUF3306
MSAFTRILAATVVFSMLTAGSALSQSQRPAGAHATLDDIDTLTVDSDFTVFMRPGVPEGVRRAALRRLWAVMDLPPSCMDFCIEPEEPARAVVHLGHRPRSVQ